MDLGGEIESPTLHSQADFIQVLLGVIFVRSDSQPVRAALAARPVALTREYITQISEPLQLPPKSRACLRMIPRFLLSTPLSLTRPETPENSPKLPQLHGWALFPGRVPPSQAPSTPEAARHRPTEVGRQRAASARVMCGPTLRRAAALSSPDAARRSRRHRRAGVRRDRRRADPADRTLPRDR